MLIEKLPHLCEGAFDVRFHPIRPYPRREGRTGFVMFFNEGGCKCPSSWRSDGMREGARGQ